MSTDAHSGTARPALPPSDPVDLRPPLAWRQFAGITAVAVAVFLLLRLLPTGTNLSHMDFRVDPRSGTAIEFCDPSNPQFIPVVAVRSPVTMSVAAEQPPVAGRETRARVMLRTGSGKPVAPEDLLVTHTRPLHLLLVDPTLTDYQHVHPDPARSAGAWDFSFTPRLGGVYRVFADFTPVATERGLYASADVTVEQVPPGGEAIANPASGPGPWGAGPQALTVERDGYRFVLSLGDSPPRAGQAIGLELRVTAKDGGEVPLEPVMDALAHLVAFDEARSGFAHLHPMAAEPPVEPGRVALSFQLTIPRAGRYVIWAQLNLAGSEVFVPFALDVK